MTAAFVVYKTNYNTRFLPGYITMRNMLYRRLIHQEKPIDEVSTLVARHEPP